MKYVIENGIIDVNAVRDNMLREQRQHYLSMHKYKIFQDKKDGRWKTTLPDATRKKGRKLIARKEKRDLEDIVADYYIDLEMNPYRLDANVTLEELYPIWIESRILEANSIRTVKKNDQDWRRYYKDTKITRIPMRHLTVNQLKDWAHSMIDSNRLNKRDYYNMAVIMKKCFEYASDEGICENTWSKVRINTKKLKRIEKKENYTQIYFSDEKEKIVTYCLYNFLENPWNISSLAIPLLFITGMRIGELVALKYCDLNGNEIIIRRTEVNDYVYDEKAKKFRYKGKIVEEHTKTDAGQRVIPFTKGARQIISMIKSASEKYGYHDRDYIFCPKSRRICSNTIDNNLYRYCDKLGIPRKSAHKIRKTYISQIINSGIDLDTVCRISGHVDLKTTFQSYYYSLEKKDDIYDKFEAIFSVH